MRKTREPTPRHRTRGNPSFQTRDYVYMRLSDFSELYTSAVGFRDSPRVINYGALLSLRNGFFFYFIPRKIFSKRRKTFAFCKHCPRSYEKHSRIAGVSAFVRHLPERVLNVQRVEKRKTSAKRRIFLETFFFLLLLLLTRREDVCLKNKKTFLLSRIPELVCF